jgi:hypothetical protein
MRVLLSDTQFELSRSRCYFSVKHPLKSHKHPTENRELKTEN